MSLAEVSIRRPVLAVVMSIVIVVFGLVGFEFLGVREYPAVDPPVVTVTTNYGGASPEVVAAHGRSRLARVAQMFAAASRAHAGG